jgi:hypothetical protein
VYDGWEMGRVVAALAHAAAATSSNPPVTPGLQGSNDCRRNGAGLNGWLHRFRTDGFVGGGGGGCGPGDCRSKSRRSCGGAGGQVAEALHRRQQPERRAVQLDRSQGRHGGVLGCLDTADGDPGGDEPGGQGEDAGRAGGEAGIGQAERATPRTKTRTAPRRSPSRPAGMLDRVAARL